MARAAYTTLLVTKRTLGLICSNLSCTPCSPKSAAAEEKMAPSELLYQDLPCACSMIAYEVARSTIAASYKVSHVTYETYTAVPTPVSHSVTFLDSSFLHGSLTSPYFCRQFAISQRPLNRLILACRLA